MWNLEYELIAVLSIVAIIGLLMGRFLCKNGENEERTQKNRIKSILKERQNQLEMQMSKVKQLSIALKEKENLLAKKEQENTNNLTQLTSSNNQREKLLEELKTLEKYKARYESLSKEFGEQSGLLKILKTEKNSNLDEIERYKMSTRTFEKDIDNLNIKKQEQQNSIEQLSDINQKQNQEITELENIKEEKTTQLEKANILNKKLTQYIDELEKLKDTIKLKDKTHKTLKEEHEELKNSINSDQEQLKILEEKEKHQQKQVATLEEERNDLLSRLRAISSVVGAVGVEEQDN